MYQRASLALLFLLLGQQFSLAASVEIPQAVNLSETGQLSRQQSIPVIVFVSRDACPYCRTLRKSILGPMFAAEKFEQRAILLEVSLDRVDSFKGFGAKKVTAQAFGEHYNAGITPTLLFLDSEGREIGKRLVGISNLELYGYYLQQSINEATQAIR